MAKKNIQPLGKKNSPAIIKGTVEKSDVPFPWMVRRTVSKKEDGTCNVLIVVPHGHDDDDRNAEKLGKRTLPTPWICTQ